MVMAWMLITAGTREVNNGWSHHLSFLALAKKSFIQPNCLKAAFG